MARDTHGTRGPMQGALPDNLRIIKEIQIKRFLIKVNFILRLVIWTVPHRGPGANQVTVSKMEISKLKYLSFRNI